MTWTTRPKKALARRYQLRVRGPKRVALFLPGWDSSAQQGCLCVEEALRQKVITPKTHLIAVERHPSWADKIERHLRALGFDHTLHMHKGALHDLMLRPEEKIDFAFFDFVGAMEQDTALWMTEEFKSQMAPGADVSFTFSYGERNNDFMKLCLKAFEEQFMEQVLWARSHFGIDDPFVLLCLLILISIFEGKAFTYNTSAKYKDSVRSMIAFKLTDFRDVSLPAWPSLYDLLGIDRPQKTPYAARKPSDQRAPVARHVHTDAERLARLLSDIPKNVRGGAQKIKEAHQLTNRLKKLLCGVTAERSDAAKRAWETRRAKTLANERKKHEKGRKSHHRGARHAARGHGGAALG